MRRFLISFSSMWYCAMIMEFTHCISLTLLAHEVETRLSGSGGCRYLGRARQVKSASRLPPRLYSRRTKGRLISISLKPILLLSSIVGLASILVSNSFKTMLRSYYNINNSRSIRARYRGYYERLNVYEVGEYRLTSFLDRFMRLGRLLNQTSWKTSVRQCQSAVETLLLPMECILKKRPC